MSIMLIVKLIEKALVILVISLNISKYLGIVKRQNNVTLSTTEAKYVVARSCCTQLL